MLNADEEDYAYQINVEAVLYRLRYPRYLLHIRESYGKVQELYFEALFQHGTLKTHELFARISDSQHDLDTLAPDNSFLKQALSQLAAERLVETVPSMLNAFGNAEGGNVNAKTSGEEFSFSKDVFWRVNFGHINRCLQHLVCAEDVREKISEPASRLLLAMLEVSRLQGNTASEGGLVQVRKADILERLTRNIDQEKSSDVEILMKENLDSLKNNPWKLVTSYVADGAGNRQIFYSIDFSRVFNIIRAKELEAVVRERFGGPACRIFRLLLLKQNLEQKQIAEMAMISVKDTRELLYKLLKAQYVQIQEVARTVDHAPSRTFYLWRVNSSHVSQQVERELFRALSNLRNRMMHELLRQQEIFYLLERVQDRNLIPLTTSQRTQLTRIRSAATRLESSLLRLDELLLVCSTVPESS